jgi:hypothetical protein
MGEHHERQGGAAQASGLEQLEAAHARHVDVADDQRGVGVGVDLDQRVGAVDGLDDVEAGRGERGRHLAADHERIVDDEDGDRH